LGNMEFTFTDADDTLLYISSKPNKTHQFTKLTECIADLKNWMTSNFLLLNSEKKKQRF